MRDTELTIRIRAQNEATGVINSFVQQSMSQFAQLESQMTTSLGRIRSAGGLYLAQGMEAAGRQMLATTGAAATGVLLLARNSSELSRRMAEVRSIMERDAPAIRKQWSSMLRDLSVETGKRSEDLAKGVYQALSSGISQQAIPNFIKVAAQTSLATLAPVEQTVEAIVSGLNTFNLDPLKDATRVVDAYAAAIERGILKMEDIGPAIGKFGASATALGFQLEPTLAMWSALSLRIPQPDVAATSLRGFFTQLLRHSKNFPALGMPWADLGAFKESASQDPVGTLRQLRGAVTPKTLVELFGQSRAFPAASLLTSVEGLQTTLSVLEDTLQSGRMEKMAAKVAESMAVSWDRAGRSAAGLGTAIVEALDDPMKGMLSTVIETLDGWRKWVEANEDVVRSLAEVAKWMMIIRASAGALMMVGGSIGQFGFRAQAGAASFGAARAAGMGVIPSAIRGAGIASLPAWAVAGGAGAEVLHGPFGAVSQGVGGGWGTTAGLLGGQALLGGVGAGMRGRALRRGGRGLTMGVGSGPVGGRSGILDPYSTFQASRLSGLTKDYYNYFSKVQGNVPLTAAEVSAAHAEAMRVIGGGPPGAGSRFPLFGAHGQAAMGGVIPGFAATPWDSSALGQPTMGGFRFSIPGRSGYTFEPEWMARQGPGRIGEQRLLDRNVSRFIPVGGVGGMGPGEIDWDALAAPTSSRTYVGNLWGTLRQQEAITPVGTAAYNMAAMNAPLYASMAAEMVSGSASVAATLAQRRAGVAARAGRLGGEELLGALSAGEDYARVTSSVLGTKVDKLGNVIDGRGIQDVIVDKIRRANEEGWQYLEAGEDALAQKMFAHADALQSSLGTVRSFVAESTIAAEALETMGESSKTAARLTSGLGKTQGGLAKLLGVKLSYEQITQQVGTRAGWGAIASAPMGMIPGALGLAAVAAAVVAPILIAKRISKAYSVAAGAESASYASALAERAGPMGLTEDQYERRVQGYQALQQRKAEMEARYSDWGLAYNAVPSLSTPEVPGGLGSADYQSMIDKLATEAPGVKSSGSVSASITAARLYELETLRDIAKVREQIAALDNEEYDIKTRTEQKVRETLDLYGQMGDSLRTLNETTGEALQAQTERFSKLLEQGLGPGGKPLSMEESVRTFDSVAGAYGRMAEQVRQYAMDQALAGQLTHEELNTALVRASTLEDQAAVLRHQESLQRQRNALSLLELQYQGALLAGDLGRAQALTDQLNVMKLQEAERQAIIQRDPTLILMERQRQYNEQLQRYYSSNQVDNPATFWRDEAESRDRSGNRRRSPESSAMLYDWIERRRRLGPMTSMADFNMMIWSQLYGQASALPNAANAAVAVRAQVVHHVRVNLDGFLGRLRSPWSQADLEYMITEWLRKASESTGGRTGAVR